MTQTSRTVPAVAKSRGLTEFSGKIPNSFEAPPAALTRIWGLALSLIVVGFGFFGSMVYLAAVSPMQSAVLAQGSFELEGDVQVVDHLEGGILRTIHVKEGERVEKGQLLATLDATRVQSQLGILRGQLAAALARQARLDAMADGKETIVFPDEFYDLAARDPSLEKVMQRQAELYESEVQSDKGQFSIFAERIAQYRTRMDGTQQELQTLASQLALVTEEAEDLKELFEKGLVSKARLYAREEDKLTFEARISQRQSQLQDIQDQIAEVEQRQFQIARDRRSRIAQDQQVLTETFFDLRQRMQTYEEILSRVSIKAPISGQIVGFETNTIGSVVAPGQILMEIVPSDVPYIVDAQVSLADIDQVAVGREARVRLSAYSYRSTPPITGEVTYVSGDSFYDAGSDVSYYKIHVKIPPDSFDAVPDVSPQSGMPVQVMVATGEQTVLTYLLDPVLGGLEKALIEKD